MRRDPPRLHAITDDDIAGRADLAAHAAAIARSSDVALHARAPGFPGRRLAELAGTFRRAGAPAGAAVLVNDRVDVALLSGADGVHLPSHGLPVSRVRLLVGDDLLVGRSTHDVDDAKHAMDEGVDYVFLGPIWETQSHPDRGPLGVAAIERAQPARVIAIGGITPPRIASCLAAGAYGVAAISALWHAADPGSVVNEMLLLLEGPSPGSS